MNGGIQVSFQVSILLLVSDANDVSVPDHVLRMRVSAKKHLFKL